MWRTAAATAALSCGLVLVPACGGSGPSEQPSPREFPAGYATQTEEDATGSVESLPASKLGDRHVDSIEELLQGRVPGLQVIRLPNGDISLKIRGVTNSLMGEGEPLLVIDGMPVSEGNLSGALRSLKPHEIHNIQVLKDVGSTSVYGMRGAHGVILITLKRS
ncbi:MAG: TonB-dependent receptor plug domain-containing protein [Longimicrobiales bacterium]